jgi:hypothetical protein
VAHLFEKPLLEFGGLWLCLLGNEERRNHNA